MNTESNIREVELKFERLIELLRKSGSNNELVSECINHADEELHFSYSSSLDKPNKNEILKIYNKRGRMEERWRKEHPFVIGYELLLPNLAETSIDIINVSSVDTNQGSYIVFSDMDYTSFVGILKSKRTLKDLKEKRIDMKFILENRKVKS